MGMPLIQSITLIQRRIGVWNVAFREVMGCSRVTQAMNSTMTGKLTTTASKRREKVRRCMLTLDRAIPTTTSLPDIMPPIRGSGGCVAEILFRILDGCGYSKDGSGTSEPVRETGRRLVFRTTPRPPCPLNARFCQCGNGLLRQ